MSLSQPKHAVFGFRTSHLIKALPHHFQNSAQIRYEMKKLTHRGILRKKKGQSLYNVTPEGRKWIHLTILVYDEIVNTNYFNALERGG